MVLFTHDVKKIKGAADKNGLKNATCKRTFTHTSIFVYEYNYTPWMGFVIPSQKICRQIVT